MIPLMRAQDEEDQENRQYQGEEEALPMVFQFPPHSQFRSELLEVEAERTA